MKSFFFVSCSQKRRIVSLVFERGGLRSFLMNLIFGEAKKLLNEGD